ncbi:hypothetical protein Csa_023929, partial [Cucumis sativus]
LSFDYKKVELPNSRRLVLNCSHHQPFLHIIALNVVLATITMVNKSKNLKNIKR